MNKNCLSEDQLDKAAGGLSQEDQQKIENSLKEKSERIADLEKQLHEWQERAVTAEVRLDVAQTNRDAKNASAEAIALGKRTGVIK